MPFHPGVSVRPPTRNATGLARQGLQEIGAADNTDNMTVGDN
jgi:hypothetical protein